MPPERRSVLDELARKALGLSADTLEVEYRDGHDEVFALRGYIGVGIARFPSSSPKGAALRKELLAVARRKRLVTYKGHKYQVRAREYESFGESAFSVELRRVEQPDRADKLDLAKRRRARSSSKLSVNTSEARKPGRRPLGRG